MTKDHAPNSKRPKNKQRSSRSLDQTNRRININCLDLTKDRTGNQTAITSEPDQSSAHYATLRSEFPTHTHGHSYKRIPHPLKPVFLFFPNPQVLPLRRHEAKCLVFTLYVRPGSLPERHLGQQASPPPGGTSDRHQRPAPGIRAASPLNTSHRGKYLTSFPLFGGRLKF